jgi:hypothetical protein
VESKLSQALTESILGRHGGLSEKNGTACIQECHSAPLCYATVGSDFDVNAVTVIGAVNADASSPIKLDGINTNTG